MLKVNDDEKASISLKRILGICLIFCKIFRHFIKPY